MNTFNNTTIVTFMRYSSNETLYGNLAFEKTKKQTTTNIRKFDRILEFILVKK